jgi:uncharacterized membrane protein
MDLSFVTVEIILLLFVCRFVLAKGEHSSYKRLIKFLLCKCWRIFSKQEYDLTTFCVLCLVIKQDDGCSVKAFFLEI